MSCPQSSTLTPVIPVTGICRKRRNTPDIDVVPIIYLKNSSKEQPTNPLWKNQLKEKNQQLKFEA